MSRPRRKQNRHSIDLSDNMSIFATIRPATPLFHRTLRRSVQDSRTFQAIVPLGMGRIHFIPNHMTELKSMITSLSTPLRLRRGSQHSQDNQVQFRPPSNMRRRILAKSPFPGRAEYKNLSPPETPTRKTPTPALKNLRLQKGIVDEYEGEYLNGHFHGDGKALYSNGDTYEGQWVEGRKQGTGKYFYCYFGASYQGDWFNDEKNGFGVMKFMNGDEVQGFWEHGLFNGENVLMEFANGCSYNGAVVRGLRCGKGKMKYYEGVEYSGYFVNDCREGSGVLVHDSWFFEGEFKADSAEGSGVLVYRSLDESGKEPLLISKPKTFHPLLPFLPQLKQFTEFFKQTFSQQDVFIFTASAGGFQSGKLTG